jgi:hypothetical protein
MTVAEAADLLWRRFGVWDALVLGAAEIPSSQPLQKVPDRPARRPYAREVARRIPDELLSKELSAEAPYARPVPSYVVLHLAQDFVPSLPPPPLPPLSASAIPIGMA